MRRMSGQSSSPTRAESWRFPKSVACIIVTSASRRSPTPSSLQPSASPGALRMRRFPPPSRLRLIVRRPSEDDARTATKLACLTSRDPRISQMFPSDPGEVAPAVPPDHGLGPHHLQGTPPILPESGQHHPEDPVHLRHPRPRRTGFPHGELLP
jgi:hypothetical protein